MRPCAADLVELRAHSLVDARALALATVAIVLVRVTAPRCRCASLPLRLAAAARRTAGRCRPLTAVAVFASESRMARTTVVSARQDGCEFEASVSWAHYAPRTCVQINHQRRLIVKIHV